jgi:hypothetical protein
LQSNAFHEVLLLHLQLASFAFYAINFLLFSRDLFEVTLR